ncbi:MAG: D-aminoacylase [Candidatus Doudnabacteria bacterium]|nr:D-aminoacylase [Candidatus Doudnabacteria bacterium]
MYDILIQNGTVIDGTGKSAFQADIAVKDGLIAEVGNGINPKKAEKIINARDQYVVPGFIDIQNHSDSYWTIMDQPEQKSLLAQGITTIVMGNCGSSLAPLSSPETLKTIQKWHNLTGVNVNWSSFNEFMDVLSHTPKGVNVASLVGHATLRRGLIGDQARNAKPDEIKVMENLLSKALDEGGLGLSMGLVYAHEVDSSTEELFKLAQHLKASKKYLSVHLRSEGGAVIDAVDEAIDLASRAGISVKISHLKVRDKKNWHNFDRVINKLESAYHQGLDVSFDVYPYSSSWSVLYTYLPRWAYEGGRLEILKRVTLPTERRKILDHLKEQQYDYNNITIATAQTNTGFVGKNIQEIAVNQNCSNEEALLNVIAATQAQVVAIDHNLNDEHVELFVSSPLSMIATDGAGYNFESRALIHPRCFGTMPAFLKMVREKKIMKWEHAVRKITSEPARLLGLTNRGKIAKESAADLVIFNPMSVRDTATYTHPYQYPIGIGTVLVNGAIAWAENNYQGSHGVVVRR